VLICCNLLGKLITEVLDIEDVRSCLALVFPFITISVEDTITKEVVHGSMESGSFDIAFEVVYKVKEGGRVSTRKTIRRMGSSYSSRRIRHFEDPR
jgi:hypothetical protein